MDYTTNWSKNDYQKAIDKNKNRIMFLEEKKDLLSDKWFRIFRWVWFILWLISLLIVLWWMVIYTLTGHMIMFVIAWLIGHVIFTVIISERNKQKEDCNNEINKLVEDNRNFYKEYNSKYEK